MANVQVVLKACRIGDLVSLQNLLNSDPQLINETDKTLGWSGLYCSVMCGHTYIAKFLIKKGAEVNVRNRLGETALHQAVESKNMKMIKLLLRNSADPNLQQNDGETPLHLSVKKDNFKIVCLLLESRADPNLCDFVYGRSALHYAVESGNTKIFLELCKYKGDMNLKDKSGKTPEDLIRIAQESAPRQGKEVDVLSLTQLTSPQYTRCNSEVSLFLESKTIDSKIKQIEMMHKRIRETVRTSVETFKKHDYSASSGLDADCEKSDAEPVPHKTEIKPEFFRFLKSLRLTQEYEVLVSAGYDDLTQLLKQIKAGLPLTEKNLIRIGMKKPGHRRRLLSALESYAIKGAPGVFSQIQCCLDIPNAVWPNNMDTLDKWLKDLNLNEAVQVLNEAGFEEVEDVLRLEGTPWALDDLFLMDIGIEKPGHRHRILAKIRESTHGVTKHELLIEKQGNNSACAMCEII